MDYDVIIEQGRSKENDEIIEFLIPKCNGYTLDIGANAGYLISKLPDAIGVDNSPWGFVGGWVKSVIKPDYLKSFYGATIQYPDIAGKYYFEIFAQ